MKKIAMIACALALAGCWTFNESEFPAVQMSRPPAGTSVAILGFEASLTEYVSVSGYGTVYVPGHYGHHHYHPGYYETVPTSMTVAQARATDMFQRRAKDAFEESGFVVTAPTPKWTVEVDFGAPSRTDGDATREAAWMLLTAFLCDYDTLSCTAKLKIRNNATGELVFSRDYAERYETNVFGLIPIFGIASCDKTKASYMQSWCYTALTDRAVADATAFLSGQTGK